MRSETYEAVGRGVVALLSIAFFLVGVCLYLVGAMAVGYDEGAPWGIGVGLSLPMAYAGWWLMKHYDEGWP